MDILHPASFAKAQRLGAKAAASEELWNWLNERTKRELAEMLLDAVSEKHARHIFRKLSNQGKI
jgi:hypothetical protein